MQFGLFILYILWLCCRYCALKKLKVNIPECRCDEGCSPSGFIMQYQKGGVCVYVCVFVCVSLCNMHKSRIALIPVPHFSRDGLAVILRSKNRDSGELMIFAHLCLTLLQAVFALSHESTSAEAEGGY